MAENKAILNSIRSFKFHAPKSKPWSTEKDEDVWPCESEFSDPSMADLLRDIFRECQGTLLELSIDTRSGISAERLIADRLSVLSGDRRIRFTRLHTLHLDNSILGSKPLYLALFPACPNIDTLCVTGDMVKSMAAGPVDLEMCSSVKYLTFGDHRKYLNVRAIETILGRFASLESLMIKGPIRLGDEAYDDCLPVFKVSYTVAPGSKDITEVRSKQLTPLPQTIWEHCRSLKQLGIEGLYWTRVLSMAGLCFAAMPQLVLLQGLSYDITFMGMTPMARRIEQSADDSSFGDTTPAFVKGVIFDSHAAERFRVRAGRDRPVGWDRPCENLDLDDQDLEYLGLNDI